MENKQCKHPLCGDICKKKKAPAPRKPLPRGTKPIRKESKKRAVVNRKYRKENADRFGTDEFIPCRIQVPGICTGRAQGRNHKQKRSPGNIDNPENLDDACNACNYAIEQKEWQQWAIDNGHVVSRFSSINRLNGSSLKFTPAQGGGPINVELPDKLQ